MKNFIIELRNNKFIKENKFDNISSFNFTKKAFYNNIWNKQTILARGLFIDTKNQEIIARSYNKFFNIEERAETQLRNLQNSFKFPIQVFQKENGFLGLLSYNKEKNDFLFATKSSLNNEYVNYFKQNFYKTINKNNQILIKDYLKNNNVTFIFEVIDIINDPHIINYKKNQVILLDIVYNDLDFSMYDYDSLKKIANNFNLPCKKYKKTLYNWNDFLYFYQKINTDNKNNIEGYVLIDSNNFMVKLKTPYYLLWKKLRYYIYNNKHDKEMIFNNIIIDNLNFKNNEDKKEALNFIHWYFKNKENITIKNIIDLRDKYLFYKENNLI